MDTPNENNTVQVTLELERVTPGALMYREIDSKGQAVSQKIAKIGNLYVRKIAFPNGVQPGKITVKVSF